VPWQYQHPGFGGAGEVYPPGDERHVQGFRRYEQALTIEPGSLRAILGLFRTLFLYWSHRGVWKDGDAEDAATEQRLQRTIIGTPIDAAEHLVWQILQPGHEGNSEQRAKTKQMLGEAVRV
jgi:hypothetical protein